MEIMIFYIPPLICERTISTPLSVVHCLLYSHAAAIGVLYVILNY